MARSNKKSLAELKAQQEALSQRILERKEAVAKDYGGVFVDVLGDEVDTRKLAVVAKQIETLGIETAINRLQ